MIGYVTIGVRDMGKAKAFYAALLAPIGAKPIVDIGRMILFGSGRDKPMLGICLPFDGQPMHPGNGNMFALQAPSREDVDALYAKAIELGATSEGEPGPRTPTFYGCYLRDPDGNKFALYKMG